MKRASAAVRAAARLFKGFREAPARKAGRIAFDMPRALAMMGQVEFIGYMTTHGGKTHLYVHEFAPGSRPAFCAGTKRNQAFLIGGRYRVTERGIVDFGPGGRETRHRARYKVVRIR